MSEVLSLKLAPGFLPRGATDGGAVVARMRQERLEGRGQGGLGPHVVQDLRAARGERPGGGC